MEVKKSLTGTKGKAPSKRQVNLIVTEKKQGMGGAAKIALVVLALAVVAAGYYAYNQYSTIANKTVNYQQLQKQLLYYQQEEIKNANIELDYLTYGRSYLSDSEKKYNDSIEMINKLRELVEPYGFITNLSVEANEAEMTVYSLDVRDVRESLEKERDKEDGMIKTVLVVTEVHPEQSDADTTRSSGSGNAEDGEETGETETKLASLSYASYVITFNDVKTTGGSAK